MLLGESEIKDAAVLVFQAWFSTWCSNGMTARLHATLRWTITGGGPWRGLRSPLTAAGPLARPSTLNPVVSGVEPRCSWRRFRPDCSLASLSTSSARAVGKCSGKEPTSTGRSLSSRTFWTFRTTTRCPGSTECSEVWGLGGKKKVTVWSWNTVKCQIMKWNHIKYQEVESSSPRMAKESVLDLLNSIEQKIYRGANIYGWALIVFLTCFYGDRGEKWAVFLFQWNECLRQTKSIQWRSFTDSPKVERTSGFGSETRAWICADPH